MNHFAKVCQAGQEKVHVAKEAEGYESEESLLKIEEITAVNGSGKQLTRQHKEKISFFLMSLCCYYVIMSGCSHRKHNDITPFLCRFVYVVMLLCH